MSIITRIKNIFSSPVSNNPLGIALQSQSLAYFSPSTEESVCELVNHNHTSYAGTLRETVKEHQLSGHSTLVLPAAYSQIVQIDRPSVPTEEISAALKWQVKDLVSITPDNMVVDYFDGPKLSGGMEKLNVVCAPKNELIDIVTTLLAEDLTISTITIEEFAFASLLPIQEEAILMVCQQPNEEINLLIIKNGQLFFSRRLRGFAQIALKSEDELTMGIVDSLSLEIQRSTDYFERQLKQAPIKAIEVLVPIKNEAFLARKLAENTNVAVSLFSMPSGSEDKRACAAAIGATQLNFMEANSHE